MTDIVRKLEDAPSQASRTGAVGGRTESRFRVIAETAGGLRKRAEA